MTTGRSVCLLCRSFLPRELPGHTRLPPTPKLAHTTEEILQLARSVSLLRSEESVETINDEQNSSAHAVLERAASGEEQTTKPRGSSLPECLSKSSLKLLPQCQFPGETVLIRRHESEEMYVDVIRRLLRNGVLGLDVECLRHNSKPILVQLASRDICVLWQVNKWTPFPVLLHGILSSPLYLKVGHGSLGDARVLLYNYAVNTVNVFDTYSFIISLPKHLHPPLLNLQGLVGVFLGQWLCKAQTRSKWNRPQLSESQLLYASTDVWASLEVYLALMKYASDLDVIPPPPVVCTLSSCKPHLIKSLKDGLKGSITRSEQARESMELLLVCGSRNSAELPSIDINSKLECAVNTKFS